MEPNPTVYLVDFTPDGFAEVNLEIYEKIVSTTVSCPSILTDGFSTWLENELEQWKKKISSMSN